MLKVLVTLIPLATIVSVHAQPASQCFPLAQLVEAMEKEKVTHEVVRDSTIVAQLVALYNEIPGEQVSSADFVIFVTLGSRTDVIFIRDGTVCHSLTMTTPQARQFLTKA